MVNGYNPQDFSYFHRGENLVQRDQRIPYIKLTYPNGVTLNVPSTIDIKMIEQYIRIKV